MMFEFTLPEFTATAPYNFVPAPHEVLTASAALEGRTPWRQHDRYDPDLLSGHLDLTLTLLTPTFVRGPLRRQAGRWDATEARKRPLPWLDSRGVPVLPGSTIRGAVRTLYAITSYSRLAPVPTQAIFYRTFDTNHPMGQKGPRQYMRRLTRKIDKTRGPHGGFLRRDKRSGAWTIEPAEGVVIHRVDTEHAVECFGSGVWNSATREVVRHWYGKPCWVTRDDVVASAVFLSEEDAPEDAVEGAVVVTGEMDGKQRLYALVRVPDAEPVAIADPQGSREKLTLFDGQRTQWQKEAFDGNGELRDPVFYNVDESGSLDFFGRARFFRVPYQFTPHELSPAGPDEPDLVQALFGHVPDGERDPVQETIASRVFFEDAFGVGQPEGGWLYEEFVPHILSSPKPSAIAHYLEQSNGHKGPSLRTYSHAEARLRGFKLYWHRWDETDLWREVSVWGCAPGACRCGQQRSLAEQIRADHPESTQYTIMRPVREGAVFEGRVSFRNLTPLELGLLLFALSPGRDAALRLGQGKPLGLGSVRCGFRLTLYDFKARHGSWDADGIMSLDKDDTSSYLSRVSGPLTRLTAHPDDERLKALMAMLNWPRRPDRTATRPLTLEEFELLSPLPAALEVCEAANAGGSAPATDAAR